MEDKMTRREFFNLYLEKISSYKMKTYLLQLRNQNDDLILHNHEVSFPSKPPSILLVDNIPYLRTLIEDMYPNGSKVTIPIVYYSQSDMGVICLPEDLKIN